MAATSDVLGERWSNWAGNQSARPRTVIRPRGVEEIAAAVKAAAAAGRTVKAIGTDELAWSLFCASQMSARSETTSSSPKTGNNLIAKADAPPAYSQSLLWVPLIGTYLNIMMQAQSYSSYLEDLADFIAEDLTKGARSEFVGHRVGVKNQS